MQNYKFVIGVVVFNPTYEQWKHISFLSKANYPLFVVDNSKNISALLKDIVITEYYHNSNKSGIAGALNILGNLAEKYNAEWLLTLDQDSKFNSISDIEKLFQFADNVSQNIGAIAPRIKLKFENEHLEYFHEPTFALITSGMCLRMRTWKNCGKYREDFFIDSVDTEYCLRMKTLSWDFVVCKDVILEHPLGNSRNQRFLFFKNNHIVSHHNALRRYYIVRNLYVTMNLYKKPFPKFYNERKKSIVYTFKLVIKFEKDKLRKLIMMFAGLADGFSGNMGEFKPTNLFWLLLRAMFRMLKFCGTKNQ